jgi:hypothetical protein
MSPEKQRIKIAEACGWTEIQWSELINPRIAIENKQFCRDTEQFRCLWLPNYLNDLNAMHEAEKVMTDKQKENYPINLARVIRHQLGIDDGKSIYHWKFSTFATAAQRAEALGLTLNLWTEE